MIYNGMLEEKATELRNKLEIEPKIILNQNYLDYLSKKIEEHFEYIKISSDDDESFLSLENGKFFNIHICGGAEKRFYSLVEQFSFAVLLDKRTLNNYQLQYSEFSFPGMTETHNNAEYLMLAFMMPVRAFNSALVKYSSADGSSIDMFKMQEEVNKYCYRRLKTLQYH